MAGGPATPPRTARYSVTVTSVTRRLVNESMMTLLTFSECAADTPEEADELYQQAEDQILEDMPNVPLWFETRTTVHTENVSNVIMDARTFIRVERVQVNQ